MPQQRPGLSPDLQWNPWAQLRATEANQEITDADQRLPLLQGQPISCMFKLTAHSRRAGAQKPWCHQPICRAAQYSPIWRQYCS